jgi:hypothetical protein
MEPLPTPVSRRHALKGMAATAGFAWSAPMFATVAVGTAAGTPSPTSAPPTTTTSTTLPHGPLAVHGTASGTSRHTQPGANVLEYEGTGNFTLSDLGSGTYTARIFLEPDQSDPINRIAVDGNCELAFFAGGSLRGHLTGNERFVIEAFIATWDLDVQGGSFPYRGVTGSLRWEGRQEFQGTMFATKDEFTIDGVLQFR